LIKVAASWDVAPDEMMLFASKARNWSDFVKQMNDAIDERMAEEH
jgi:hypothetical protein